MPLVYKLIFPLRVNDTVKLACERWDFKVLKRKKRRKIEILVPNLVIWIAKPTR